ncbi:MAG: hypothetical protein M1130_00700 [Actinobacteria bacterium]|nr:hypothetical protein [Actinomycetota bacterium]
MFFAFVSDDAPDRENSVEGRDKLTGSTSTGGCRLAGQRDGRPPVQAEVYDAAALKPSLIDSRAISGRKHVPSP